MEMSRALTTDGYNEDYIEIEVWPMNRFGSKLVFKILRKWLVKSVLFIPRHTSI